MTQLIFSAFAFFSSRQVIVSTTTLKSMIVEIISVFPVANSTSREKEMGNPTTPYFTIRL